MSTSSARALFDEAVCDHAGLAARIASSYERDPHRVDDLVQETFLALWRALPSYRGEAAMPTFLARIAHNVCVSHVRRAVRQPAAAGKDVDAVADADGRCPADSAERSDRRAQLMQAIRALPLPLRQVVTLYLEDFSGREIAQALDISENNAAVRLTRARAALRERLGASP